MFLLGYQLYVRHLKGADVILWIEKTSEKPVDIQIKDPEESVNLAFDLRHKAQLEMLRQRCRLGFNLIERTQ